MTRFTAEIAADTETIARLTDDVTAFLEAAGVEARATHHVALVLDEILTNVSTHGGAAGLLATVALDVEADRVLGEIVDRGEPFDPRAAAPPDLASPIDTRKIGGLGLHLVRRLTSALDYRYDGQQNRMTFCVLRGQQPE